MAWETEDVQDILLNPVYTFGSQPTITDKQWIAAQKKLLGELGEERYFGELLRVLRTTFGQSTQPPQPPLVDTN